jgi:hypothetical protein
MSLRTILAHISQVFYNPSFLKHFDVFVKAMRDAFMQSRARLGEETWFVFISVLLCGAQIMCSRAESIVLFHLALDAMFGPFYADGFLHRFDLQLRAVFAARNEFRDVWIEKFESIYKRLLK